MGAFGGTRDSNKPTYLKKGPYEGMQGEEGATRIDIILANGAAWKAFAGYRLDYDLGLPGHVGLRIKLALPKFKTHMNVIRSVQAYKIEGDAKVDEENKEANWT